MRPLVHSHDQLLWTEAHHNQAKKGAATQICVTVHSREHPLRRAGACGRPNWVDGHNQERPIVKKKRSLPNETEEDRTLTTTWSDAEIRPGRMLNQQANCQRWERPKQHMKFSVVCNPHHDAIVHQLHTKKRNISSQLNRFRLCHEEQSN